jgi:hypothetical protein
MRLGVALSGIVLLLPPDLLPISGLLSLAAAAAGIAFWILSGRAGSAVAAGE